MQDRHRMSRELAIPLSTPRTEFLPSHDQPLIYAEADTELRRRFSVGNARDSPEIWLWEISH